MIGVWIQKNPRSWKKRCTAWLSVLRTRVTAPKVLVRGRRCATSRRYSNVWCFGEIGYVSGSSTQSHDFQFRCLNLVQPAPSPASGQAARSR